MSDYPNSRVAQAQAGADIYRETVKLLTELGKNPIVELVIAFALIEKLQERGVFGSLQATLMEGGVATIITAQQIAPLVPDLLKAGQSIAGAVAGIAALGAGVPK